MSGWIIISRAIRGHWIWKDPERLKWWIDLIFMANFDAVTEVVSGQRIPCERGQFATTLANLAKNWKADYHQVYRFMRKLESDGMIRMDSDSPRHWLRITIVKYDEYQISAKPIENESAKQNAKPTDGISGSYEVERKTNRKTKTENAKPMQNQSQNQSIENEQDTLFCASQEKRTSQPLLKEINNISSTSSIKGACEQKFIDELKESGSWLELMAMRFHLGSVDEVRKRLDDFLLDQTCRGTEHNSLNDVRRHFNDWLRIVISKEQKETEYADNRERTEDKRRGTQVTATSGQDYEGDF